jgi:soluble lytic murein transglycosylase-like protein
MTYRAEIVVAAGKQAIDPNLVQAVMEQESNYVPWAWNPEPRYRYFVNVRTRKPFRPITDAEGAAEFPPRDFPTLAGDADQEWWGQQASWGLMQVLGAVAREDGCTAPYLTALCDPMTNLQFGCQHLAGLLAWARGLYTGLASGEVIAVQMSALAAYNGGRKGNAPDGPIRNKDYAQRVMARYDRIRKANTP